MTVDPKEFGAMSPLERRATVRCMSADAIKELALSCSTAAEFGAVEDAVMEVETSYFHERVLVMARGRGVSADWLGEG